MLCGLAATASAMALPGGASAAPLATVTAQTVRDKFSARTRPISVLLPRGSEANLAPVAAAFKTQAGVEIELVIVDVDQINSELMLDAMLGRGTFDVALPATFTLPDLVDSGAIRPLDDFALRYEPPDFRDGILYSVGDKFDGKTYGFQTDGDAYVMFYHKAMMQDPSLETLYEDQFGQKLRLPHTWADLDRQIRFFHQPDQGRFGGLLFRTPGYLAWEWWVRFHAKGVWPLAPDMTPQIAGDAGIAALEDLIAITDCLLPEAGRLGLFENWKRYAQGDVYCNIGWGGTQKYLNSNSSKMRGQMLFGPTPGGDVNGGFLTTPYFNWGWSFVVSSVSPEPELAYLFSLFACSPEMSTLAIRQAGGFFDPYRPEHYSDAGIGAAYSQPFLAVQRQSLEGAIPDLYLRGQSEYFHTLGKGLDAALHGQLTPAMALGRVAQEWELITNRIGRAAQVERWQRLRGKYPQTARRLLRDLG
tara:strand:+ start:17451 stop:18872 length:1422 start_codon:yes stop_codon:yes gene_type:complete